MVELDRWVNMKMETVLYVYQMKIKHSYRETEWLVILLRLNIFPVDYPYIKSYI